MENKNLKKQALLGLIWTMFETIGSKIISLVIQIILARLLLPKDFGIIGMITIFIALSQTLLDSGFQNALIREQQVDEEDYSTVFIFNFSMAVVLYIILFFVAPFVSNFYQTPILTNILRTLSLILIINSFGLIQRTILTRKLDFKTQTKISLLASAISGVVAVTLAWQGLGVWSLVIQQLLSQLIQSSLLMYSNHWIPKLIFSKVKFRYYFQFGWKLTASGLINTLYNNVYYVLIGKFYSPTDLGYYTNSQKFNDVPVQSMTGAIQKVTYPLLSKMNSGGLELKIGYQKIIRYASMVSFFMMLSLAATANYLIPFIFGPNWIPSIPYFQILCLAGMFYPINAINLNILQVKGRSDLFLRLEIIKKIIGIVFIMIALLLKKGVLGLVWANMLATIFNTSLNIIVSARLINYTYFEQLKDLYEPLLSALISSGTIFLIGKLIIAPKFVILVIQGCIGILVYYLCGRVIFKFPEFQNFSFKKILKNK